MFRRSSDFGGCRGRRELRNFGRCLSVCTGSSRRWTGRSSTYTASGGLGRKLLPGFVFSIVSNDSAYKKALDKTRSHLLITELEKDIMVQEEGISTAVYHIQGSSQQFNFSYIDGIEYNGLYSSRMKLIRDKTLGEIQIP